MSEPSTDDPFAQPRLRDALEEVRPWLVALDPAKLTSVNVDLLDAAATVRAALPAIQALRSSIATHLVTFELSHIDSLEVLALALIQSHSLYRCTKAPSAELLQVVAEITQLRDRFLRDVAGLSKRGTITGCPIKPFRGTPSHQRIASDTLTLTNLLRNHWQAIASSCGVTETELDRAEVLAERLFRFVGARAQTPTRIAEAALERQKVYTQLVRVYDQVRKAVSYLRWEHGDADKIAPSLYGGRKVRKRTPTAVTDTRPQPESQAKVPATTDKETDPFLS